MEPMERIDIIEIERRARALRAQEMQRLTGLFGERLRAYVALLLASVWLLVLATGRVLQPLFAWNPQQRPGRATARRWAARANHALRSLFAWNPHPTRHPH